jgi:predicted outer membrane repeat protein
MVSRFLGRLSNLLLLAALLAGSFLLPSRVHAGGGGGMIINTTSDNTNTDGFCSLREAITNSNNNAAIFADCSAGVTLVDVMTFDPSLGTATITLTSNLPSIVASNLVTLDGDSRITIDGANLYQPLYVHTAATLNLLNITIAHGHSSQGGGLYNDGTANLTRVSFLNNSSTGSGGGVLNGFTLNVSGSTFKGNIAASDGGGLANVSSNAHATIYNSTFANNTANNGGGLENNSGSADIINSTFSGNSANSSSFAGAAFSTYNGQAGFEPVTFIQNSILANSPSGTDCTNIASGSLTGNHNIIESTSECSSIATLTSDPKLGALKGKPAYFPVLDSSPAINAGDDSFCSGPPVSGTSQNGVPRPQGAHCEIGSVEAYVKLLFKSAYLYDGWVLESTATSSMGGSMNATATTLRVGDDATRKQYRSILSFTTSGIPDGAIVTAVKLKVKRESTAGTGNPLTLLGGFKADVRKGPFGLVSLQITDFQAAASKTVGPTSPGLVSGWYTINLYAARSYVNKLSTNSGVTQVRLRFTNGDNGNSVANYLSLFSGNALLADRPQLIVYYYLP